MKAGVTRILIVGIALGLGFSVVFAGAVISEFRGEPGYNKVVLTWVAESEQDLKGYEIERSFSKDKDFQKVGFVQAKSQPGRTEYKYEDDSVFKTSNDRTFYYRLKLVNNDGTSSYFKMVISVTPTISSARHTWGSIKAMFR